MKLYYHPRSGHSHRVTLFLSILGVEIEKIVIDIRKGEGRTPQFLALNPFAQVPVLVDGDTVITESNAILVYLAKTFQRTDWLPETAREAALVETWLSIASGELHRGPAAARMVLVWNEDYEHSRAVRVAHKLFELLDGHLATRSWLTGARPTIADLANYAYVRHAPEGEVDIGRYGHLLAWLARIEALPGFVALPTTW